MSCIGQILEGFELLPFSLSSIPVGYATFGDAIQFKDSRGNLHRSYATDIEFNFADGTEFSCKAKSLEIQGLEYPGGTRAQVEQVLGKVEEKISAYDTKLKQMNDLAANALGFYYTEIVQPDGSVIAYRHNKLRLAESKIVYKTAADGFFVTSDYQGTDEATTAAGKWTSGFDSNGDAVLNILYAIGIQAKWINTRGLTAEDNDGKVTFRINADTGEVEIDPNSFILGKKNLQEKFSEIDNAIASSRNMTMQLDNDYQSISVYNDGNIIGAFPTVTTTATVLYNSTDITNDCSFTITTSDSITGFWNNSTHTYTVKSLSANSGWVSIRATYLNKLNLTRKFTVAKLYAGDDGRAYYLDCPAVIVKRMADGTMSPENLTFSGFYREGDSVERTAYKGRFKIEETSDGKTWMTVYNSPAGGENSITWSMMSSGSPKEISAVRCTLYAPDGATVIDYQTVEVVLDAEALTQEQVLNILTNNGEWKGIRYLDGHLYFSFDAARGGTLLLGGENNENGIQKIFDKNGALVSTQDINGYTLYNGNGLITAIFNKDSIRLFSVPLDPDEPSADFKAIQLKGDSFSRISGVYTIQDEEIKIEIVEESIIDGPFISFVDEDGDDWVQGNFDGLSTGRFECTLGEAILNKVEIPGIVTMSDTPGKSGTYLEFQKEVYCRGGIRTYEYPTVTSGYNCYINQKTYQLSKFSSSSKRYKVLGNKLSKEFIDQLYEIEPIMAKYKDGYLDKEDERVDAEFPMFTVENIEKYFPLAVDHVDGKAENWNERIMIPAMFAMLKEQRLEIEKLKKRLKGV